eukprot:1553168-Pleurochrysis_carterae.AAC.3
MRNANNARPRPPRAPHRLRGHPHARRWLLLSAMFSALTFAGLAFAPSAHAFRASVPVGVSRVRTQPEATALGLLRTASAARRANANVNASETGLPQPAIRTVMLEPRKCAFTLRKYTSIHANKDNAMQVRHRGPDGSGIHVIVGDDGSCSSVAHERLAIVDPLSGNQPLFSHDRSRSLSVNGIAASASPI